MKMEPTLILNQTKLQFCFSLKPKLKVFEIQRTDLKTELKVTFLFLFFLKIKISFKITNWTTLISTQITIKFPSLQNRSRNCPLCLLTGSICPCKSVSNYAVQLCCAQFGAWRKFMDYGVTLHFSRILDSWKLNLWVCSY